MRIALRIQAFLISNPLTLGGVGGLALPQKGPALIQKVRERALDAALESPDPGAAKESLEALEAALAVLKGLPVLPLSAGLLAASVCLFGFALWPSRKRAVAAAVSTGASPGYATEAQPIPVHSKRDRKRSSRVAMALGGRSDDTTICLS